jgi:hypothetical protein
MTLDEPLDAAATQNVWVFLDALARVAPRLSYVRAVDAGRGRVLLVALAGVIAGARSHRRLLRAWHARARAVGLSIPVRPGTIACGTQARAHEPVRLGGAGYLRISVGVEPRPLARAAAQALAEAVEEVAEDGSREGGWRADFDGGGG